MALRRSAPSKGRFFSQESIFMPSVVFAYRPGLIFIYLRSIIQLIILKNRKRGAFLRRKKYSCPNGCTLPPRRKVLQERDDGTFGFDYHDFTYCPICGTLMPYSLEKLRGFFEVYNLHPLLKDAVELLYKSEFEAAARETFVTVETMLKKKSKLDLHGSSLAAKALSFDVNGATKELIKEPLVKINELRTESEQNEQKGIMHMLMGFFEGPRNIFQHNHVGSGASDVYSIIITASFFLRILDGHSITKNGHWIPNSNPWAEIYANTPNRFDRWKLGRMMKKRSRIENK